MLAESPFDLNPIGSENGRQFIKAVVPVMQIIAGPSPQRFSFFVLHLCAARKYT